MFLGTLTFKEGAYVMRVAILTGHHPLSDVHRPYLLGLNELTSPVKPWVDLAFQRFEMLYDSNIFTRIIISCKPYLSDKTALIGCMAYKIYMSGMKIALYVKHIECTVQRYVV